MEQVQRTIFLAGLVAVESHSRGFGRGTRSKSKTRNRGGAWLVDALVQALLVLMTSSTGKNALAATTLWPSG